MATDFLKTDIAFHIYTIVGAALLLLLSGWVGLRELSVVRALSPTDFSRRFPGKQPWSKEGLEARINALENYRRTKVWSAVRHLGMLITFGFAVPSVLLFYAVLNVRWLFENSSIFVRSDNEMQWVQQPSLPDAAAFVASQFMKSITDVLEIFQIRLAPISIAHDAYVAKFGIFGYHLFVGAFALAALYAVYVLIKVGLGTDAKIDLLRDRLRDMHRFSSEN